MDFKPQGVCSQMIHVNLTKDGIISSVSFDGGCNGNLQGISTLVKGMHVDDAIDKLEGIKCGSRATSCPDQLSIALKMAKSQL